MTPVDLVIVVLVALLAAVGFQRGFLVGALGLGGFVLGAVIGTRVAGALVPDGSSSPYAPLAGLLGALLGGAVLAGGLEGVGFGLRRTLGRIPGLGLADGALGALLSACVALGICWVVGAIALQTPGARQLRADIQRSVILQRLNDVLPPSGPLLNALARFDPLPGIDGPRARVAAPPSGVARRAGVMRAAASVVRITGTACGLGVEGSGWVAAADLVVTNAHVVAGQDDTSVQVRGAGRHLPVRVLVYAPRDDVAVLRVGGLDGARPLRLAPGSALEAGRAGAVLGFPRDGPYDVRAARLGATSTVLTQDAYGDGPLRRSITAFRALVRPGNSGGPLVDLSGRVLTTVFASARGGGPRTGYGVPDAVVRRALERARSAADAVSTGPCAS